MLKLSRYIRHLEIEHESKRLVLIFSTRSGDFRIIGSDVWSRLRDGRFSEIVDRILDSLKKSKFLVDSSENELLSILEQNKTSIANSKMLYTVIQPTASCPLGCHYCGQSHTNKLMSESDQAALLNRLKAKLSPG